MKKRKTLKKAKQIVAIVVGAIVVFFLMSLTGPISDQKAIALAETYCSQGLYCSGYNYNKGDNTCSAIFRSRITDRIEKSIIVREPIAEKLYDEYGYNHE